jgi:AcrR family transcriptional regulator
VTVSPGTEMGPANSPRKPASQQAAARGAGRPRASAASGRPGKAAQAKSSLEHAPDVVRAAAHLFYERGYEATSVQDVADAAGLLKGSLYYYIRTKEDLLYAVVEQAHGSMTALVDEVKELPEGPVLPRLERFLRRHMELLLRDRDMYGVVLQDYSSLSGGRRKQATATRNEYALFLQGLIEEGQREGIVAPDLNPRLACLGVLGMMNWTYKWHRPSDPLGKTEIVDGLVDLALRALGVRPSWPLANP